MKKSSDSTKSNFNEFYKSNSVRSTEYRQSERRIQLLEKQRQKRNELVDKLRCIEPSKKTFFRDSKNLTNVYRLQQSEWLQELPEDISKWYIRPCPKGQRCLVIATNGKTRVFNKNRSFNRRIHSTLPGGYGYKKDELTVLDCIYIVNTKTFFVLDVIAYNNLDLTDCEAEFRLYWIESKVCEDGLSIVSERNECSFQMIQKYDCSDFDELNQFLSVFPIWPNDSPQLDGFLFYHKESSYIQGSTPLVGWLFPFMIPEIFNIPSFNEFFMNEKPTDYKNYTTFIDHFNQKQEIKRKQKPRFKNQMISMDASQIDEDSIEKIVIDLEKLESNEMNYEDGE